MPVTVRPFRPHPRPVSNQAFRLFTVQHWPLSLAAGNSIPLGASLNTRRLAQHGPPYRVRHPTDWSFTSVAPHAGIAPTQSLRLPGGELLPEEDFHRPGHATRRRTNAPVPERSENRVCRRAWIHYISVALQHCCARGRAHSDDVPSAVADPFRRRRFWP